MRLISLMLILVVALGCGQHQSETPEARYQVGAQARLANLKAFAQHHGAFAPWFEGNPEKPEFMLVYQAALMRSQVQPIAFIAYLDDIVLDGGKPIAKLWSDQDGLPRVSLELVIPPDQVPRFKGLKSEIPDPIYVVAKDLDATAIPNRDGEFELVAKGLCVAIEPA